MSKRKQGPRPAWYDKRVALILQGGGALGSYQAGVYEALAGSEYLPSWVAGISIGAVNAAIIAGNPPESRVSRLQEFWEGITEPTVPWPYLSGELCATLQRRLGALTALLLGQPGFFRPYSPFDWFIGARPIAYYDTTALKNKLERLVDFGRINACETRFSVAAVNVETGNFSYFDNAEITIRPEHVMASAALPPGFPPVEIDGELYWDGGLVSNTPLQYVLSYYPRRSLLAFQVDVFPARGRVPHSLDDAAEREKDIRYSSRTRTGTDSFRTMHEIRYHLNALLARLPEDIKHGPDVEFLRQFACVTTMDIAQLIYRPAEVQGSFKDYDFNRSGMRERWAAGMADAQATLAAAPWLEPIPPHVGTRTFDVALNRRAVGAPLLAWASNEIAEPAKPPPAPVTSGDGTPRPVLGNAGRSAGESSAPLST
jgi:NTE family protein